MWVAENRVRVRRECDCWVGEVENTENIVAGRKQRERVRRECGRQETEEESKTRV